MNQVIKSTDVRKNWSEVIDTVVRKNPVFIKRNRDILTFLSLEQLDLILDFYKLSLAIFREEDGSYTGSIDELDILGNAGTKEEIIEVMCDELIEYAEEYMENFDMYYHSSNRKSHFPYVYKVIAHEADREKIKQIFIIRIEDGLDA
jgi:hypothetical protein